MRDLLFTELRNLSEEISLLDTATQEAGNQHLFTAVNKIVELCNIARREGLLALEEEIPLLKEIPYGSHLSDMLLLILDGVEPQLVEELSLTRYFSSALKGYDGLTYLLYLVGSLAMQAGENSHVIEAKLLAMLPKQACEAYHQHTEETPSAQQQFAQKLIEKYCHGRLTIAPGDAAYLPIKTIDQAFCSLPDAGIQRLLRELDNKVLTLAMKGISGEARRHIFYNLSDRLAYMIAEDMYAMGPVHIQAIAKAADKIHSVLQKLISCGEIHCPEGDLKMLLAESKANTEKKMDR